MTTQAGSFCAAARLRLASFAFCWAVLAHAGPAAAVDSSPIYLFYNTRTATHFYTISTAEPDNVSRFATADLGFTS